uniref:B1 homeodomain mating type protein n=1 Tax=Heterobasidion irregulare TaxID=984962 RepID=S5RVT0_9AGAM|nr:b1 homeodomain mating type protein [Heterobasidion irregulare]
MPTHRLFPRFEKAQNDLLSALVEGPTALEIFEKQWIQLSADLDKEAHLDHVDEELMAMAHTTASIVSTLMSSFLHLDDEATHLYDTLARGVQDTLSTSLPSSHHTSSDLKISSADAAHHWLTQNIHNPYPSTSTKEELAKSCGLSVDCITKWFRNARKHIGWTALARHHFEGSRSAMVQAARRAYVESDVTQPLPLHIQHAFSVIRKNIKSLHHDARLPFSDIMGRNPLEGWSGDPARPIVPDEQLGGTQTKDSEESLRAITVSNVVPLDEENSESLKLLSSRWDDSEEDTTPPPPIAGSKRRADSELEIEQNMTASMTGGVRLFKRRRSAFRSGCAHVLVQPSPPTSKPPTCLDSQVSYIFDRASTISSHPISIPPRLASPPSTISSTQLSTALPTNRKRRLSDASSDIVPKRPRNMHSGPRTQTVSDSLPRAVHESAQPTVFFEDWYQTLADAGSETLINETSSIPSPATTALNTLSIDASYCELPVLFKDFIIPSQQVDLSDEDFRVMIASGHDMSSNFISLDQGVFEMWPSLDNLFPSSCTGSLSLPTVEPVQNMINLDLNSKSTSQIEHDAQPLPPSLLNTSMQPSHETSFLTPILCQDIGFSIAGNELQQFTEWSPRLCVN